MADDIVPYELQGKGAVIGLNRPDKRNAINAQVLEGLADRGVIAPGKRADINLIDFNALRVRMPEVRCDLPAGGRRLV